MRKPAFLFIAFMGIYSAQAQTKEGTILYERRINLRKQVTDEQVRAMMPEYSTARFTLSFSDSVSVYKPYEDENNNAPGGFGAPDGPTPPGGGRGGFRMRSGGPGGSADAVGGAGNIYRNYAITKGIESHDLGNHTYLIEDSIRKQKWKITGETNMIEGHNCRRAVTKMMMVAPVNRRIAMVNGNTTTDTAQNKPQPPKEVDVEAWYAEDMPSPVGPDNYGNLPGVILIVIVDNGTTTYSAVAIKKEVNAKDIKAPTRGKKVTRDEYNGLVQRVISNQGNGNGMGNMRSFNFNN